MECQMGGEGDGGRSACLAFVFEGPAEDLWCG
jgi:hypothetical protein